MTSALAVLVGVTDPDDNYYGESLPSLGRGNSAPAEDVDIISGILVETVGPALTETITLCESARSAGERPTREALTRSIASAAPRLVNEGDTLFVYYSGHGSRIPGGTIFPDDHDVLCLADGFLLDVELVALWQRFLPTSRVLMIADCCHAGDVTTVSLMGRVVRGARTLFGRDPRGIVRSPDEAAAAHVAERNADDLRDRFARASASGALTVDAISCALMVFAGCGPDELLPSSGNASPFARALLGELYTQSWTGYDRYAQAVIDRLKTPTWNPVLEAFGRRDPNFESGTPPFSVSR